MNDNKNPELTAKAVLEVFQKYIRLSKYLFAQTGEFIYDVNEIPKTNEFYKAAKAIAKKFEIDWKTMTHEESNRIMLALLSDTYNEMACVCDKDSIVLDTKIQIIKPNKKDSHDTE